MLSVSFRPFARASTSTLPLQVRTNRSRSHGVEDLRLEIAAHPDGIRDPVHDLAHQQSGLGQQGQPCRSDCRSGRLPPRSSRPVRGCQSEACEARDSRSSSPSCVASRHPGRRPRSDRFRATGGSASRPRPRTPSPGTTVSGGSQSSQDRSPAARSAGASARSTTNGALSLRNSRMPSLIVRDRLESRAGPGQPRRVARAGTADRIGVERKPHEDQSVVAADGDRCVWAGGWARQEIAQPGQVNARDHDASEAAVRPGQAPGDWDGGVLIWRRREGPADHQGVGGVLLAILKIIPAAEVQRPGHVGSGIGDHVANLVEDVYEAKILGRQWHFQQRDLPVRCPL